MVSLGLCYLHCKDVSAKNGTSNTPIVITSLGGSAFATDEDRQDIREAIQEVTFADSLLLPIPVFPYATTDGTHPDDSGDRALGYTSVEIYNGASAPTIQNISMDGAQITVTFDKVLEVPVGNYSLEGVRVEVGGVSQTISSFAHVSGADTIVTLSSAPSDTSDVSVFINWGTRTTQGSLSQPKSLSSGLYSIPVISKNNDFSLSSVSSDLSFNVSAPLFSVSASAAPAQSTLNAVLMGIPDGTYSTRVVITSTGEVVAEEKAWSSGSASFTLSVPAGTSVEYYAYDTGSNEAGLQLGVTE